MTICTLTSIDTGDTDICTLGCIDSNHVCGVAIALDLHKRHGIHGYINSVTLSGNNCTLANTGNVDHVFIVGAGRAVAGSVRSIIICT